MATEDKVVYVQHRRSWGARLWGFAKFLIWLLITFFVIQQLFAPSAVVNARQVVLDRFQQERNSRVIALIHRQESVSLLGVPVSSHIDLDDSEAILRAIRLTPDDQPIDMILHTPGGLVLAAEQIAKALAARKAKVTVFVPHYAMSGGTLIALAADEIVMDPNAVLGPVDPQIGSMPAASILKVVEHKKIDNISDEFLVLADMALKARNQVAAFVTEILMKRRTKEDAARVATAFSEGRWTHDYPITVQLAKEFGLPVTTDMPRLVYDLMGLYPQGGGGRPSVLYVPTRRDAVPARPPGLPSPGSGGPGVEPKPAGQ